MHTHWISACDKLIAEGAATVFNSRRRVVIARARVSTAAFTGACGAVPTAVYA